MTIASFMETPRFPENISYGSGGGPTFNTKVFTSASGFEQRNVLWDEARAKYNVTQGIRSKEDMDTVLAFFYAVRGRATGFRFKDWADYTLASEQIGTGNSTAVEFQITKAYTAGSTTYSRIIYKPVSGTLVVTVNGNSKTEGTDYTVNYVTGKITFTVAPPTGHAIRVTGEFDVPVRFDTDEINITHEDWMTESWSSINIIELKTNA